MTFKVLVCGGRHFNDNAKMWANLDAVHRLKTINEMIVGGADGADSLANRWARQRNVFVKVFFAEWDKYGNRAGPIRNQKMLDEGKPNLVIAFAGGRGTGHMIQIARDAGVQTSVIS